MVMQYWLFKTEPDTYSIDDLKRDKKTMWSGVRNYQARNMLRDEVKKGDLIIFYHSSCAVPAAVGVAEVIKEAYPDPTQFDPKSEYFDATAKKEDPRWFVVDVKFKEKFKKEISLSLMRTISEFSDMRLLAPGNRLSLFPISQKHFELLLQMGR